MLWSSTDMDIPPTPTPPHLLDNKANQKTTTTITSDPSSREMETGGTPPLQFVRRLSSSCTTVAAPTTATATATTTTAAAASMSTSETPTWIGGGVTQRSSTDGEDNQQLVQRNVDRSRRETPTIDLSSSEQETTAAATAGLVSILPTKTTTTTTTTLRPPPPASTSSTGDDDAVHNSAAIIVEVIRPAAVRGKQLEQTQKHKIDPEEDDDEIVQHPPLAPALLASASSTSASGCGGNNSMSSQPSSPFRLLDNISPFAVNSSLNALAEASISLPEKFLQNTPPSVSRTPAVTNVDELKEQHQIHLLVLTPILVEVLTDAVRAHNTVVQVPIRSRSAAALLERRAVVGGANNTTNNTTSAAQQDPQQSPPTTRLLIKLLHDEGQKVESATSSSSGNIPGDNNQNTVSLGPPTLPVFSSSSSFFDAEAAQKSLRGFVQYETTGIDSGAALFPYVQYLLLESWASTATFIAALILMDRFLEKMPPTFRLTFRNVFKLFVAASRVSSKVVETRVCNNATYARAARLSTNSVNQIEQRFLNDMQFEVSIGKTEWDIYAERILAHV